MQLKKIGVWVLAALALTAAGPAWAEPGAGGCRRAVVVYLDVSGSMYEQGHFGLSPWSEGRRRSLMENTVRFLEKCLLAPGSRAIRPGDSLVIRGFYSRVDSLGGTIDSYAPQRDMAKINAIDQVLDCNRNGRYDLCDAVPNRCKKSGHNRFLADQSAEYTDFAPVARDMVEMYRLTPMSGGAHGFDELTFIILTDGGHDQVETLDEFQKEMQTAAEVMAADLKAGRIKVLIFGLGDIDKLKATNHDVRPVFNKWLYAAQFPLDPGTVSLSRLNGYLAGIADRVQIKRVKGVDYHSETRRLGVVVSLENRTCDPLVVERIACLVRQGGRDSALVKTELPLDMELEPWGLVSRELAVELAAAEALAPGQYVVQLMPWTRDLGPGDALTEVLKVKPPESPAADVPAAVKWILAIITGAAVVGVLIKILGGKKGTG